MKKICILGDGSWGTTLAILLSKKGYDITLWSYDPEYASILKKRRENIKFLPQVRIPKSIKIVSDINLASRSKDFIIIAVPSLYFRNVIKSMKEYEKNAIFVSVTKGIEIKKFKRMSEIILEELKSVKVAVLSGPSIAYEVVRMLPSSVVVAASKKDVGIKVQSLFFARSFRVYTTDDVIGVELAGALKNIIAIASGVADGLGLGNNSKAALLSRGLIEMIRFCKMQGASSQTLFGLSGLGDMVTTCFSKESRNRSLGEKIGRGKKLDNILKGMDMVAEGIYTTEAVYKFSQKHGIDMPITEKVYEILYQGKNPRDAVYELMAREPKPEITDSK